MATRPGSVRTGTTILNPYEYSYEAKQARSHDPAELEFLIN